MRRISLLVTVASMLAVAIALSGVAQAAPVGGKADAKCLAEAVQTLPPGFKPADYTFIGGTEGSDTFTDPPADGDYVFCGFRGDDSISTLDEGDIFLGGRHDDAVGDNLGTFYGGLGFDFVGSGNQPVDGP
jgi:hypothetical protein